MRQQKDSIERLKETLQENNINDDQLKSIDGEIKLIVSEASEFAEKSNLPDKEELMTDVYI